MAREGYYLYLFRLFLSVPAVAHFAVRRIGDVVERFFYPAIEIGESSTTVARFNGGNENTATGEKCAFYQNGSTATRQTVDDPAHTPSRTRECPISEAEET